MRNDIQTPRDSLRRGRLDVHAWLTPIIAGPDGSARPGFTAFTPWNATTAASNTEVHRLARSQFAEKELVDLTLAIVEINGWNRLAIGFPTPPGSYHRRGPHGAAR